MPLPLDLLEASLNERIQLTLKDGRQVEGLLAGYDQYMNLVLEEATERGSERDRPLGTVLLRGNNLLTIARGRQATVRST